MIFYLHYILMTSGLSGICVLLGVFLKHYSGASQGEIGALLMSLPFVSVIIRPIFCSMADRKQAHKLVLALALSVELIGYTTVTIIPFFPGLYQVYPRLTWYILIIACHIGNAGLGVVWSLGDCLAVNMSQKSGTPFGRMRLMGTISWGVYGFIIGQLNEIEYLPKYVPGFLILLASILIEIILVILWNNEDFKMVDPLAMISEQQIEGMTDLQEEAVRKKILSSNLINSTPSSLGGTLRMSANATNALLAQNEYKLAAFQDKLQKRLKTGLESGDLEGGQKQNNNLNSSEPSILYNANGDDAASQLAMQLSTQHEPEKKDKNFQITLLRLILFADGRVFKYVILYTLAGAMLTPMSFVFLSMEGICQERDYNFSQLAGAVLISQAGIETVAFLILPYCLARLSRSIAMGFAFFIMFLRYAFYAGWYYDPDMSPYWAVISEWGLGFSYGIYCTIQADVSLMFANQCRLFIPELRRLGFLSESTEGQTKEEVEAEERSVKMALRATMQALYGGFMDGFGGGLGLLTCGIFVEFYSYITLWKMLAIVAATTLVVHQLIEITKSPMSDTYQPAKGTKSYEIMQLSKQHDETSKGVKTSATASAH